MQNVPKTNHPTLVGLQEFCDMLEVSIVHETMDLGSSIAYKVTHPESGKLVMINTTGGGNGYFNV